MQRLIDKIKEQAVREPASIAVIASGIELSYRELNWMIERAAAELSSLGVERLAIYGPNNLDWILLDLAAASLGVAVVPVPLFFSDIQIAHLLHDSGVDTLFCAQGYQLLVGEAEESRCLTGHYRALESTAVAAPEFAKVTYTSGSTGNPKGACLSGDTLMTIVDSLATSLAPWGLGAHLCLLPFATLLENVAGIYLPLYMGRTLIVDDTERLGLLSNHAFDENCFAEAIGRYHAGSVILLPQMLKAIVEMPKVERIKSLQFIAVGGGKVAPGLLEQALKLELPVFEGYGLTECGSCVALNTPGASRIGSVGKPLPHAQLRFSEQGEILVTGAAMQGYLHGDVGQSTIATGDVGHLDEDGFLYITGRIKNVIVSSFGRNISPEWVEGHFLASSVIGQIAVFGEGQPALSAVISSSAPVSDIDAWVRKVNSVLPDYARVRHWIRSDQPFDAGNGEMTSNGKVCREVIERHYSSKLYSAEVA